uniref:pectate lyase n=1 Tax=Ditylenchus dipsaci TaxID=166011 RepID=A0A915E7W5_9BILA
MICSYRKNNKKNTMHIYCFINIILLLVSNVYTESTQKLEIPKAAAAPASKATTDAPPTGVSPPTTAAAGGAAPPCDEKFPTPTSSEVVNATENVTKDTDYGMKRLSAGPAVGGTTVNEKDQPILTLEPGVTVSNLIIGSPGAKGIWCKGSCTLKNVWWEKVGTHAAGFGTDPKSWANAGNKYVVDGGGAQDAPDKIFIQQGAGTTTLNNFYAHNASKLLQSCGDCPTQFKRNLVINNSTFQGPGLSVTAINSNLGDTVSLNNLKLCDSKDIKAVCQDYQGNTNYDQKNAVNFMQSALENVKPGQPMTGKEKLGGIRLVAINQLIEGFSSMVLSPFVGTWLDTKNRLTGVLTVLLVNNGCVAASAALLVICLSVLGSKMDITKEGINYNVLIYYVALGMSITLCALSKCASDGEKMLFTKDWIFVLNKQDDPEKLSTHNARLTAIDQCAQLLAPLMTGYFLLYLGYMTTCLLIVIWNVLSWTIERYFLLQTYTQVKELAIKDRKIVDDPDKNVSHLREKSSCEKVLSVLQNYTAQKVFPAAFGLALLYMTVLGFDGIVISYGKSQKLGDDLLGILRSAASFMGICGAVFYAVAERILGIRITGIAFARIGLWMADLSITQIMQQSIIEEKRNEIFGTQNALCKLFSMLKDMCAIMLPDPRTFGLLVIMSMIFVILGYLHYIYFLIKPFSSSRQEKFCDPVYSYE